MIKKFGWIIGYVGLLILFLSLGIWQLNRADEKEQFLSNQADRMKEQLNLTSQTTDEMAHLRFKNAVVNGYYDTAQQFLLDNQILAGKTGYFVLTPFKLENSTKAILVNRGWIPLLTPRSQLPNVTMQADGLKTLTGRLNSFPSIGIKLEGANLPTKTIPAVLGVVDIEVLSKKIGYELFSVQLELDASLPDGFKREWTTSQIMQPQQHLAYALQWFGLAFVLTIIFIKFRLRKNDNTPTTQK